MDNDKQRSGFEDDPDYWNQPRTCDHREHQPPMHLVIPPGKQYRHVCPGCGQVTILRNTVRHTLSGR